MAISSTLFYNNIVAQLGAGFNVGNTHSMLDNFLLAVSSALDTFTKTSAYAYHEDMGLHVHYNTFDLLSSNCSALIKTNAQAQGLVYNALSYNTPTASFLEDFTTALGTSFQGFIRVCDSTTSNTTVGHTHTVVPPGAGNYFALVLKNQLVSLGNRFSYSTLQDGGDYLDNFLTALDIGINNTMALATLTPSASSSSDHNII